MKSKLNHELAPENNEEELEKREVLKEDINDLDYYNQDDLLLNEYEDYSDYEKKGIFNENEENNEETEDLIKKSKVFNEKIKKTGVIYISYIPEGLSISLLRRKLEKYGVNRVFFKPQSGKKNHFKEGWIEFNSKIMAKLCEYELNGKPIGGKKRDPLSEEIWNFRYLHKFKWHHLMEKIMMKQKMKEQKLKTTINQAYKESNFVLESYQQSKKKRKRDELNPDSVDVYKRNVKQIKPIKE